MSGFVKPSGGTIAAFGENLLKMADYRRSRWGLRRTFQTEMAIEQLSVYDNVAMIHEHSSAKRATRRADVLSAIEFVGLTAPPKSKVGRSTRATGASSRSPGPSSASRAWCCSTSRRPDCPTRRPSISSQVIRRIPEQFGALTILVDHDMSLVSACCETTAVLDFGKLIASGPTAEVLRDEHVINAYLGTEEEL